MGPSQRRLFSSASVHEKNYRRWMNGVALAGSKVHLLGFVRSLQHCLGMATRFNHGIQDHEEYFSALCNLHSLSLYGVGIEAIGKEGPHAYFSASRETLTYLSLGDFFAPFCVFVTLVDYFPNIRNLQLCSFGLDPNARPIPTLSRPLRGKFKVYSTGACSSFLDRFARLDLQYEEVVLHSPSRFIEGKYLERALQISATTARVLRLTVELQREQYLPALIKTPSLPNPPTFKQGLLRRSPTSDNSKSRNWWWLFQVSITRPSSLQSPPSNSGKSPSKYLSWTLGGI